MKKIFPFFLFLLGFVTYAQESKPTKEETIAYINEFLESQKGKTIIGRVEYKGEIQHKSWISSASVEIQGTSVRLKSSSVKATTFYDGKRAEVYYDSINHNKIFNETLKIQFAYCDAGFGLAMTQKVNEEVECIDFLPLWRWEEGVPIKNYEETQIFKAFEHLRKLCGAPEPLKF